MNITDVKNVFGEIPPSPGEKKGNDILITITAITMIGLIVYLIHKKMEEKPMTEVS